MIGPDNKPVKFIKAVWSFLVSPVQTNLACLAGWLALTAVTPIFLAFNCFPNFAFFSAANFLIQIYLLVLPVYLLVNRLLRRIYIICVTAYLAVFMCFDVFCIVGFDFPFTVSEAALVAETNYGEATEMLSTYLSFGFVSLVLLSLAVAYVLFRLLRGRRFSGPVATAVSVVYLIFIAVVSTQLKYWRDAMALGPILKPVVICMKVEKMPTPEQLDTHPMVSAAGRVPQKVVLIIGESHCRNHSSLYGYEKQTNPLLDSIAARGNLVVFPSVESADVRTSDSFKKMMSAYDDSCGGKWYECDNLPVVLRNAGVHTRWLSNQGKVGLYVGAVSCYSELCDTSLYTAEVDNYHDEHLLPLLADMDDAPSFDVIHLMGSHEAFIERYPFTYLVFRPEDYPGRPEHQRHVLAHYDNSLLYNDWVLTQIINFYKDKEAIVIYTSDHALDLYETDENYFGHARIFSPSSEKVSRNVPFLIYMSDSLQTSFPDLALRVRNASGKEYNLTDLMYTIMDIYSISYADGRDIAAKSILH